MSHERDAEERGCRGGGGRKSNKGGRIAGAANAFGNDEEKGEAKGRNNGEAVGGGSGGETAMVDGYDEQGASKSNGESSPEAQSRATAGQSPGDEPHEDRRVIAEEGGVGGGGVVDGDVVETDVAGKEDAAKESGDNDGAGELSAFAASEQKGQSARAAKRTR